MTRIETSAVLLLIPLGLLACARGFGADGGPAVAARSETASRPRDESAIVFTPDGMPAAGAQVAVANWTAVVKLEDGKLSYSGGASERGLRIVETDAAGRFSLPAAHEAQVFVVAHDSGFAEIDDPRPTRPTDGRRTAENAARPPELRIALQRWGRVMGTMLVGDKPVAGARFRIAPLSSKRSRRAPLLASHLVETDATGRFVALRVPPGRARCQRLISLPGAPRRAIENEGEAAEAPPGRDEPFGGLAADFDVPPGAVIRLALGSPGKTIIGRIEVPDGFPRKIDWSRVSLQLRPRPFVGPHLKRPAGEPLPDPWGTFLSSDEGRLYIRERVVPRRDGTFRIEGLPPADYRISVDLPAEALAEPVPARREPVRFAVRISLAGRERESSLIDVGVLTLPANAVAGAAASQPDASTLRRADSPDSQAQALAERAHAGIAAIDRLPRLYYRFEQGSGDVDGMDDLDAGTLERLKEAIDGPVFRERRHTLTLAWSGTQAFWTSVGAPIHEDGILRPPHCTVWTAKEAWHRSLGGDEPRINLFSDHRHLAGDLANIGYFRVTPHRFWWGRLDGVGHQINPIPPDQGAYHRVGAEQFDGELCDVVESWRRTERLWISRESGRLRGVLGYSPAGPFSEGPLFKLDSVQKAAGRTFSDQMEYTNWLFAAEPEQIVQLSLVWSDVYAGEYKPCELIAFRDYREIAPDVWAPFREDRTCAHPAADGAGDRRKYSRFWAAVQELRTDFDLTKTIEGLRPRDGESVNQDQRFGMPIGYTFRSETTPKELLQLIDVQRRKPEMRGSTPSLTMRIEQLIGRPAPELPRNGWIGGPAPKLAGSPYLVHFWADWSAESQRDFSRLNQLAAEGAIVVGIHPAGTPAERVAKIVEDRQLGYPVLLAPANLPQHYDQRIAGFPVWAFPYCVLVDVHGKIAAHGPLDDALLAKFRELRE